MVSAEEGKNQALPAEEVKNQALLVGEVRSQALPAIETEVRQRELQAEEGMLQG